MDFIYTLLSTIFSTLFILLFIFLLYYFIKNSELFKKDDTTYYELNNIRNLQFKAKSSTIMYVPQGNNKIIDLFYLNPGDEIIIVVDDDGSLILEIPECVYD